MKIQLFAALSAAVAAAAVIGSGQAQAADAYPLKVSLTGIDLGTAKGHAEAMKRIRRAAADKCSGADALDGFEGYGACVKAKVDAAAVLLPVVAEQPANAG